MFEELLNKDIFTALINAPKMCKEMDNKRIDMSALEFMCAVPIVAKVLEMSNKERKGAIDFASAVVALNITEKAKNFLTDLSRNLKMNYLLNSHKQKSPLKTQQNPESPRKTNLLQMPRRQNR